MTAPSTMQRPSCDTDHRLSARVTRRLVLRARVRQGRARVRVAFWPLVQTAIAAAVAYLLAGHLLGHTQPFFAAIAVWACLGFSFDRDLRQIAEIAFGVTFGLTLGGWTVYFIGSGWWQLSTVLLVTGILARFVDRGPVLAAQAGTQAIVIVGFPALTGGVWGRSADAIVGGLVALLFAVLTPTDPRRRLRTLGAVATSALADVVQMAAAAARTGDEDGLEAALVRARAAEPALLQWLDQARLVRERVKITIDRKHDGALALLETQAVLVERAMRSVRVLLRRAPYGVAQASDAERAVLANLLERFGAATAKLGAGIESGGDVVPARNTLLALAADADPRDAVDDWGIQSLVVLLRSPIVDLLQAAGLSVADAHAALDEL